MHIFNMSLKRFFSKNPNQKEKEKKYFVVVVVFLGGWGRKGGKGEGGLE